MSNNDFDLDVRVATAPVAASPDGFLSMGSTCYSCHYSCDCQYTDTCGSCGCAGSSVC
ncbi:FDLD family class I lanthipeptide [Kitasatospora sp. NPDC048545]|uniref:FDLD family class I lanthipeptide n=1 Tax=unclassified Kitasatospora TaxID=2633591 RepID=UPI0033EFCBA7